MHKDITPELKEVMLKAVEYLDETLRAMDCVESFEDRRFDVLKRNLRDFCWEAPEYLNDYKGEPRRSYQLVGEIFTVEDFIKACRLGAFMNSDGMGFYLVEIAPDFYEVTTLEVDCSFLRNAGFSELSRATHVEWCNK